MLDGQIFSLKPWGHHLVNILFHALNTALVFLVFRRLTGNLGSSFVVALLFGLHPLRVESVAWVAERKDVLSGFFWLLTIWAYARFAQTSANKSRNPWLFYSLALIFFAFGLMSKSMLVTLPCVLLLLDYWPLQRYRSKTSATLFLEKIPFFFLTAAFSLTAYIAQKNGAGLVSTLSLNSRIANALVSHCRYLGKILWPANLAALYPCPDHWPLLIVFLSAALLLVISIVFITLRRTQPFLLIGWLWFLGTMIPVIGLIQIGAQSMADRYTYIPCLGILVALVWGCGALVTRCQCQKLACGAAGIIALICLLLSRQQITYWKDTQALFQRSVDVTSDNTLALVGLGACLADEGKTDDAIQLYRRALQISPHYYESHYNLGMALARQGHTDEAIAEFRAALQDRPGVADAYINLGAAFAAKNNPTEAITQFQEAAHLNPSDPLPHDNLAILFANQNRFDEAIIQLQQALQLQPNNAPRCLRLGEMLIKKIASMKPSSSFNTP